MYKNYDGLIAICDIVSVNMRNKTAKYKIVDGYHRYSAAKLNKKRYRQNHRSSIIYIDTTTIKVKFHHGYNFPLKTI